MATSRASSVSVKEERSDRVTDLKTELLAQLLHSAVQLKIFTLKMQTVRPVQPGDLGE